MLEVRPVATVSLPPTNRTSGPRIMLDTCGWPGSHRGPLAVPSAGPRMCPAVGWSGGSKVPALEPESLSVALLVVMWASWGFCFHFLSEKWGSLLSPPLELRGCRETQHLAQSGRVSVLGLPKQSTTNRA